MDLKPNDFFIGLVEFITIMLPGAALAMIILLVEYGHPIKQVHPLYLYAFESSTSILFWFAFVLTSFGLGYFLSSIASGLDPRYDAIRAHIYPHDLDLEKRFKLNCRTAEERSRYLKAYEQSLFDDKEENCLKEIPVSKLSEVDKLFEGYKILYLKNIFRRIALFFFELEYTVKIERSHLEARKILNRQPEAVRNATHAYKWAGIILEAYYPAISDQATRTMAASKFFRSIVIVSLIFLVLQIFRQIPRDYWLMNAIILLLSFREYIVQRHKSVQKTYQSIVSLSHYKKKDGDSQLPVV